MNQLKQMPFVWIYLNIIQIALNLNRDSTRISDSSILSMRKEYKNLLVDNLHTLFGNQKQTNMSSFDLLNADRQC